jgi:hypothetical protein
LELDYEILLNVIAYIALAAGLLTWRRQRILPKPSNTEEAFGMLEKSLRHAFPDLRDGFTWREELSRAKRLKPDLGWDSIEKDVSAYEMYRYGQNPPPKEVGVEFLKLVRFLKGVRPRR